MQKPACILVVDDVVETREAALAILASSGYAVLSAANAAEALVALRGDAPPDLLFTDIVLGRGLNGFELAQQAHQFEPALKTLYATGYAWNPCELQAALPGSRIMIKPYRAKQLLREVAALLDEEPWQWPMDAVEKPVHQPTAPRQAILVVEDDPRSRAIAIELFAGLGLPVFNAWNGREALDELARHPEIGALFADLRLPGMTGLELAEASRRLRPELMIVLTSAQASEPVLPGTTFVAKPWQTRDFSSIAASLTAG